MSEYACRACCFMDASFCPSALEAQAWGSECHSYDYKNTAHQRVSHLDLQPRRKWEFYLVHLVTTKHYSTVITTLRMTMLLCCWWPSADASTYSTLPPRWRMWAEHPGPITHLRLPTISGPLVTDARSAPSHLKSPLYQASADFYPIKKMK